MKTKQLKTPPLPKITQPKGVYAVLVLTAAITCVSLFDKAEHASFWAFVALVGFVASMVLVAGKRRVNQFVMIMSLGIAVSGLVGLLLYTNTVRKLNNERAASYAIIANTHESFTDEQMQAFLAQDKKITVLQKRAGSSETMTYFKYGALVIGYSAVLLYVSQLSGRK